MHHKRIEADYFSADVMPRSRRFVAPVRLKSSHSSPFVELLAGACEWCRPDFVISRDHFPHHAFEFVWAGRGQLRLGGLSHDIGPGSVYFYDSTLAQTIHGSHEEPMVKYFFSFGGPRISTLLQQFGIQPGMVSRVHEPARMAELLEEAIDYALKQTPEDMQASSVVLEHALSLCAKRRGLSAVNFDSAYTTYLRCRNYVVRNYKSLLSIKQVAVACSVTAPYLTRLFQRFDRETPYDCLRRLRMNEALHRLREPNIMVKTVAMDLGFASLAHFSRVFKQHHGVTPQDVRTNG